MVLSPREPKFWNYKFNTCNFYIFVNDHIISWSFLTQYLTAAVQITRRTEGHFSKELNSIWIAWNFKFKKPWWLDNTLKNILKVYLKKNNEFCWCSSFWKILILMRLPKIFTISFLLGVCGNAVFLKHICKLLPPMLQFFLNNRIK